MLLIKGGMQNEELTAAKIRKLGDVVGSRMNVGTPTQKVQRRVLSTGYIRDDIWDLQLNLKADLCGLGNGLLYHKQSSKEQLVLLRLVT